jgi:hypothetical protein
MAAVNQPGNNLQNELKEWILSVPPVTRSLIGLTLAFSLAVGFKLLNPYWLALLAGPIFTQLQASPHSL